MQQQIIFFLIYKQLFLIFCFKQVSYQNLLKPVQLKTTSKYYIEKI